jgi:hypothetical protein
MKYILIISAGILVLIGGGLFFIPHKLSSNLSQPPKAAQQAKKDFGPQVKPTDSNTKTFLGTITEMTDNGFIVKNMDGSIATVILSDKTSYMGKRSDLLVDKITAGFGPANKDGEISAVKVQISPEPLTKPYMKMH